MRSMLVDENVSAKFNSIIYIVWRRYLTNISQYISYCVRSMSRGLDFSAYSHAKHSNLKKGQVSVRTCAKHMTKIHP